MKCSSLILGLVVVFLGTSLSQAADQAAFDELIKSLGKTAEEAAKVTDPKLRAMVMAGLSQRQLELSQFLKEQGDSTQELRLKGDPLGELRSKWETRHKLFQSKQDDLQRVLDLCDTLTRPVNAPDPIQREGLLLQIEKLMRREGVRQEAVPDPHWIWIYTVVDPDGPKPGEINPIPELFFPKLESITDLFIKNLREKVVGLRAANVGLAEDNATRISQAHDEYMAILGRAGLFPQGTYVGEVKWAAGTLVLIQGDQAMKIEVPPRPVGQLKLIVSGVNVSGVVTVGEGETRSSGRLMGRFDPVAWKLSAKPIDSIIKVPGATSTKYDAFQFQGAAEQSKMFRGDWELDLTISVTTTDENGNEVSGTIRIVGRGPWETKLQ